MTNISAELQPGDVLTAVGPSGVGASSDENILHWAFALSLGVKGIFALVEVLAGIAVYFIDQQFLLNVVLAVFQDELRGDPHDPVANFFLQAAQGFSVGTQHFVALYLLANGLTKTVLIGGLLRGKLGYYPAAIVVFVLFAVYQVYRYSFTHSVWLLLLTLVDAVVIWLTWREYKQIREARSYGAATEVNIPDRHTPMKRMHFQHDGAHPISKTDDEPRTAPRF